MDFVAVRHKPHDPKVYWFEVPARLADKVKVGASVECNTSQGIASGKVAYLLCGFPRHLMLEKYTNGASLRKIAAVETTFPIDKIRISYEMSITNPSPSKIAKRVKELYKFGGFTTPVKFTWDGLLLDGYTAYLVARMFDHEGLRGMCVVETDGEESNAGSV